MYESKQRQFFWMSADVHYYRDGFFCVDQQTCSGSWSVHFLYWA